MKLYDDILILFSLFIGYMMHTYSRRSFQNVINYTIKDNFLKTESIGMIVSSQQIGYTISKFCQPFIIDKLNPKIFFILTMPISFLIVFLFSYSTSFTQLMILYGFHGFALAFAWPSLAKILKKIIPQEKFGFWWSVLCTSSNFGAILGALVSTFISDRSGWRASLRFCAVTNLFCAIIVTVTFLTADSSIAREDMRVIRKFDKLPLSYFDFLRNPVLLSNNIMFFCVYICRYIITDWYQVHLSKLYFSQSRIARFISCLEIGGILGSLIAGIMADYIFVHFSELKNPRLYVIILFGGLSTGFLHLLIFSVDALTTQFSLDVMGFSFGFFIFGPVAICGIIAIEGVPQSQQGTSYAINVIFANVAMLVTGYPVSYIGQHYGWNVVFLLAYFFIFSSTVILLFFRNSEMPIDDKDSSDPSFTTSNFKTKSIDFSSVH